MRWRVCVVLIATACAAPEGIPSDEPTDEAQHHHDRRQQLPAARPAEAQRAEQQDAEEAEACYDKYWCAAGEGEPGEKRPPKKVAPSGPNAPKAPRGAKNVLLIIVDDLRTQLNKAYGHPYMITPAMDKLAQSPGAVTFSRAYAQAAHCAPSRNSFMSGRYPDRLKVWNVYSDFRAANTPEDPITPIPQYFKQHGYLTLGGGKVYHPNHPKNNDPPSWSEGTVRKGRLHYFNDHDHGCPDGTGGNPNIHGEGAHEGGCGGCPEDKPEADFYDGRLANWTITALRHAHEDRLYGEKKPFFIATGFRRPHTPWNVAQRFVDMYKDMDDAPKHRYYARGAPQCAFACGGDGVGCDFSITKPRELEATKLCRRTYYATVTGADFYIGQVLDELANLKMADDTAVALFGDHGWHLGEGGLWAKYTNMEHATRVPLMIRAPWLTEGQTEQILGKLYGHQNNASGHQNARSSMSQRVVRSSTFVELVDIFPTLVDLAGIPQPPHLEGRSLKQAMVSPWEKTHRPMAQSQFAHCCQWGSFDSHRECGACEKLPNERISYMGYAVRNADFRFVAWYRWDGPAELPHCEGLMAVELYKHVGDDGLGDLSFDGDFEAVNLAANITLGDPAAMRLEMHMNGSHASTTKNMHEHLLQKFPKTFGRCSPGVPMRLHPRKFPVSKLTKGHDGVLSPFEEAASWPPDTTCPDPE